MTFRKLSYLAFFIIAFAASSLSPARAEALGGCFGYVRSVAGDAQYMEKKGGDWKPVTQDMCLYEEFGLKTGPNSGALVVLDDSSAIRLNQNTEIYFTSVSYRFLLTRLTGISMYSGEIFMDITEGYNDIFVQTTSAGVAVSGANADLMVLHEDETDATSPTGTAVYVLGGAVYVFDVFLKYRVTVGPGQQTNVARKKPPQEVYFFNDKVFNPYIKSWRDALQPEKVLDALNKKDDLSALRDRTLACPSDYYKASLWCCPAACANGPSDLPQDIYCPDGTYYVGNRRCCDLECSRQK